MEVILQTMKLTCLALQKESKAGLMEILTTTATAMTGTTADTTAVMGMTVVLTMVMMTWDLLLEN